MEKLNEWNSRIYSQKRMVFFFFFKIIGKDTHTMSKNITLVTITNELSNITLIISAYIFIEEIVIPHQNKEKI